MKTQLEQFKNMLTEAGVPFQIDPMEYRDPPNTVIYINTDAARGNDDGPLIGYWSFCTVFKFSPEEKLIQVGIWE